MSLSPRTCSLDTMDRCHHPGVACKRQLTTYIKAGGRTTAAIPALLHVGGLSCQRYLPVLQIVQLALQRVLVTLEVQHLPHQRNANLILRVVGTARRQHKGSSPHQTLQQNQLITPVACLSHWLLRMYAMHNDASCGLKHVQWEATSRSTSCGRRDAFVLLQIHLQVAGHRRLKHGTHRNWMTSAADGALHRHGYYACPNCTFCWT
jgi:hypothetical protein